MVGAGVDGGRERDGQRKRQRDREGNTRSAVCQSTGQSWESTRMGRLVRRVLEGDEVLAEWSDADPASYERAAAEFERLLGEGHTAVRVEGAEHRPVTTLPPDAELVLLTTAMGGG
jgi:hypothetical protein